MVAKLNAKIPGKPKTINLDLDGLNIRFDYDSFSNKTIVTDYVSWSINKNGGMRLGYLIGIQRG